MIRAADTGVRTAVPTSGMYIIKAANKVAKVVIK